MYTLTLYPSVNHYGHIHQNAWYPVSWTFAQHITSKTFSLASVIHLTLPSFMKLPTVTNIHNHYLLFIYLFINPPDGYLKFGCTHVLHFWNTLLYVVCAWNMVLQTLAAFCHLSGWQLKGEKLFFIEYSMCSWSNNALSHCNDACGLFY